MSFKSAAATTAAAVMALTACSSPATSEEETGRHVTSAEVTPWPFAAGAGRLACPFGNEVVFTPDGSSTTYALNGRAMGTGKYRRLEPDDPMWLSDETVPVEIGPPIKITTHRLIEEGLKLCQQERGPTR